MSESVSDSQGFSVLIVAYRRWRNISTILDVCQSAGISKIFLSLDPARDNDTSVVADQREIERVVLEFEAKSQIEVRRRRAQQNQGCAVNVIKGCDWAFQFSDNLIILEDDCLPSITFFQFCRIQLSNLVNNPRVWLICGTQFAPKHLTNPDGVLSRYALTWGWATSKSKWNEIRESFFSKQPNPNLRDLYSFKAADAFWNAGARRALSGFTDVWDTVLVQRMWKDEKYSILPPENLILNNGNDQVSTHTDLNSPWTGRQVSSMVPVEGSKPAPSSETDLWLTNNFYKIRWRHVLSTKVTLFLDLLFHRRRAKFPVPLKDRLLS